MHAGPWVDRTDVFDNAYYADLLRAGGWRQIRNPAGTLQWVQVTSIHLSSLQ